MGSGYVSVIFELTDDETVRIVAHNAPYPPDTFSIVACTVATDDVDGAVATIRGALEPFACDEENRYRVSASTAARLAARVVGRAAAAPPPRYPQREAR